MTLKIVGLVLAAGASSRMGQSKPLMTIGADTFVARVARTLVQAGAAPTIVVTAPGRSDIRDALERRGVQVIIVENQTPDSGQLSSLAAGLAAIEKIGGDAALVCPVDVPLVRVGTAARVIDEFRKTGAPVVRPASGGRHGHPVLFASSLFEELRRADPAVGARAVVRSHAAQIVNVATDDEGAFVDIDTPEDYERWVAGRDL